MQSNRSGSDYVYRVVLAAFDFAISNQASAKDCQLKTCQVLPSDSDRSCLVVNHLPIMVSSHHFTILSQDSRLALNYLLLQIARL